MQIVTISLDAVVDAPWRTSVNVSSPGYKPPGLKESFVFVNIVASLERDGRSSLQFTLGRLRPANTKSSTAITWLTRPVSLE